MTKVINFQLKFPKRLRRNVKVLKYWMYLSRGSGFHYPPLGCKTLYNNYMPIT